jgi:hypothetical protein
MPARPHPLIAAGKILASAVAILGAAFVVLDYFETAKHAREVNEAQDRAAADRASAAKVEFELARLRSDLRVYRLRAAALEKSIYDAGVRQQVVGTRDPVLQQTLLRDQIELEAVNREIAETRAAIQRLRNGG